MKAAPQPPNRHDSDRNRDGLRRARRVLWGVVLVLHVGYAVAYGFEARYYVDTIREVPYITLLIKTFGRSDNLSGDVSGAVLATGVAISVWHVVAALRMARMSWKHRRFMFRARNAVATGLQSAQPPISMPWRVWHTLSAPWRLVSRLWAMYCGVDGVYFELVTTLRESFEIATQTKVVYRLSRFVAEPGVNTLASLALVANCWSTPVLRVWLARSPRGPLIRTVVGTCIATVFTVLVPATVFTQYYRLALAPVATRYDPHYFIDRGNLFQQIFTLTWLDLLSTRFAAVLAIASLETIKRKAQETRKARRSASRRTVALTAVVPEDTSPDKSGSRTTSSNTLLATARLLSRISLSERSHRVSNVLFFATGVAILVLHIIASSHSPPLRELTVGVDCPLVLRPWLFGSSQCAVLRLNCHRLGIQGSQRDWETILAAIDDLIPNLMAIRFSHCPQVEVPTQVQEMKGLIQFVVFNATLASWSVDSTLTTRTNPLLTSVVLMRVRNMRELPPGLLSDDFPAIVFETSDTDLQDLPSNLARLWPPSMEVVALEHAQLSYVPPTLCEIKTGRLSLARNNIQQVPAGLFTNHNYHRAVAFTDNPLNELPTQDVTNFRARNLGLIGTNVSELPDWVVRASSLHEAATPFVHADNSPLCRLENDTTRRNVKCTTSPELLIWYSIPLDDIAAADLP